ncbi:MAG: hypothetical protein FWD71_17495 [Oscillospiraceae bacterium]|nr:hypothetical protein [Oscillospiraceae bacterium]
MINFIISITGGVLDAVFHTKFIAFIFIGIGSIFGSITAINICKNHTFRCMLCDLDFKANWHKLRNNWRMPKRYRMYKELDTGTYERVNVQCPKCKCWNCAVKLDKKYIIKNKI